MENLTTTGEHLLVRAKTKIFFMFAALTTTLLAAFMYSILLIGRVVGYEVTKSFLDLVWVQIVGFLLGVVGAPSALLLWLGMCWYWLELDHSPRRSKTFWFFIVFLGNCLGAPAYYFFVYRKANGS